MQLAPVFAKVGREEVRFHIDVKEKMLLREGFAWGELYQHRKVLNWTYLASGRAARGLRR